MIKELKNCLVLAFRLYKGNMRYLYATLITGAFVFFARPLLLPLFLREIFQMTANRESADIIPLVLAILFSVIVLSIASYFLIVYGDAWAIFLITDGCEKSYRELYELHSQCIDQTFSHEEQVNRIFEGSDGPSSGLAIIVQCLAMTLSVGMVLILLTRLSLIMLPAALALFIFEILRIRYQIKKNIIIRKKTEKCGAALQGTIHDLIMDVEQLAFMNESSNMRSDFYEAQHMYWLNRKKSSYLTAHCNFGSDVFFMGIKSLAYSLFPNIMPDQVGGAGAVNNMLDSFRSTANMTISFAGDLPEYLAKTDRLSELLQNKTKIQEKVTNTDNVEDAININHLTLEVGNKTILKDASFRIKKGQKIALTGENGCGKSTLLKVLMGEYELTTGAVIINGKNISELSHEQKEGSIGYIPVDNQLYKLTALQNISMGRTQGDPILPDLNDLNFLNSDTDSISSGQKRLTNILRALQNCPAILFADEPDAELHADLSDFMMQYILDNCQTAIIVTHNSKYLKKFDVIYIIDDGKITQITKDKYDAKNY